jgi:hypothetical protein
VGLIRLSRRISPVVVKGTAMPLFQISGMSMRWLVGIVVVLASQSLALADEPNVAPASDDVQQFAPEDLAFFESKIRPLLAENCYSCHGVDKNKGDLRLDSRGAILMGGESGAAIVVGDIENSLLLQAVRYESFEMPPGKKLPDASVRVLEEWVQRGAPWPKPGVAAMKKAERGFSDEERAWWALQPVKSVAPPVDVNDQWSRNEIDRFIYAGLTKANLQPAAEADRATLIRRLSFDLIGLPPTAEEVAEFVGDNDPAAYEKLVHRLLASRHYGERWARHWLDVVRYADSDGYRIDHYRPDSWRFRDYAIRSFNSDKPYDRFVQEQIAGDELFPDNPDALIATGFLRHWIYEYNNRDVRGQWDIILNEITDTTSDVFLGVGLQCARCHDHKFDPVLQKDYFRLRAFFEAIDPRDTVVVASTADQHAYETQLREWKSLTADLRAQIAELEAPYRSNATKYATEIFPLDIQDIMNAPQESRTPLEQQLRNLAWRQVDYDYARLDDKIKGDKKDRLLELRRELATYNHAKPTLLPTALVVTDVGSNAPPTIIPKRMTEVGPGYLSIMDSADSAEAAIDPPHPPQETTGRRSALARWLTQAANPLSTRVIVNRIWQGHFGRGLAQNASDFGTLGGPPSHPELLDWLTDRFVNNGWMMKDLHRLIVTSATYRQATEHPRLAEYQLIDPGNRWYWRFNTRRLDAEQIRDAILAVSGQLDLTAGGPGVQSDVPRRSIYLRVMRNERDALLDVFDLPLFFSSTSSRDTTTSPVQSLLLFNSQIMMNHGLQFADYLQQSSADPHETLRSLWISALGRLPSEAEVADAQQFLVEQTERISVERTSTEIAAVPIGRIPYRDGQAVIIDPGEKPLRLSADSAALQHGSTFTLEACLQIRSVYETGAVRTIAAKWDGGKQTQGWSFGVTGKGSRRKPQTLVLQLFGEVDGTGVREATLFSDQHVELNVPYFAAVSVTPAVSGTDSGTATFYLKNLANDDELMQVATITHSISSDVSNSIPLSIGFRTGSKDSFFDGLLDDVRLSSASLPVEQLLLTSEKPGSDTVGYWRFEPVPGIFEDSAMNAIPMTAQQGNNTPATPARAALADLCHVILNSNEFLYVR